MYGIFIRQLFEFLKMPYISFRIRMGVYCIYYIYVYIYIYLVYFIHVKGNMVIHACMGLWCMHIISEHMYAVMEGGGLKSVVFTPWVIFPSAALHSYGVSCRFPTFCLGIIYQHVVPSCVLELLKCTHSCLSARLDIQSIGYLSKYLWRPNGWLAWSYM